MKEKHNEFTLKKELLELEKENIELKHKYKMEELEFQKTNDRNRHEMELEKIRIKSSEVRKSQMRRENGEAFKY